MFCTRQHRKSSFEVMGERNAVVCILIGVVAEKRTLFSADQPKSRVDGPSKIRAKNCCSVLPFCFKQYCLVGLHLYFPSIAPHFTVNKAWNVCSLARQRSYKWSIKWAGNTGNLTSRSQHPTPMNSFVILWPSRTREKVRDEDLRGRMLHIAQSNFTYWGINTLSLNQVWSTRFDWQHVSTGQWNINI